MHRTLAFVLFKGTQDGSLKDPPPPKYQNVFYKLFLKLLNVTRNKTCYKNKWVRPIIKTVNCPGSITKTLWHIIVGLWRQKRIRPMMIGRALGLNCFAQLSFWFRIAVADPGGGGWQAVFEMRGGGGGGSDPPNVQRTLEFMLSRETSRKF